MILEIRTYRLHPGTGQDFVRVMQQEAIPLLEKAGIRVVDSGMSLVAEDGHEEAYLIRAFSSLEQHKEQEDTFYSSDVWLQGPREGIVSRIVMYHTIVLDVPEEIIDSFRRS